MLETYTEATLSRLMAGKKERRVAVAVSGGADSMALCLLAHGWAKKRGLKLTALTINHGLRKDAAKEARKVALWCRKRRIPHEILSYEGKKPLSNIMEEARNIRYKLLFGWCRENNACLLVAHNLEDQAETFLLRLQRGSGISGLACMPESAKRFGLNVLRPLLAVSRRHLESYLKKKSQPWVEDPTNADPQYARNSLRMALESNPHTKNELTQRLFESARSAGRARHALEKMVNAALESCVEEPIPSLCLLDTEKYGALEEEVALRLLSQVLEYVGGAEKKVRYESLYPLHEKLATGGLSRPTTLAGCLILPDKDSNTVFCPEHKGSRKPSALEKSETVSFGAFEFRALRPGYVLKPLGEAGLRAIRSKKKSLLKNLPPKALVGLPSLWKIGLRGVETIVFAPHMDVKSAKKLGVSVGYTPSKKLEITPFAYCRARVYTVG